jgi:hypothetical protein
MGAVNLLDAAIVGPTDGDRPAARDRGIRRSTLGNAKHSKTTRHTPDRALRAND